MADFIFNIAKGKLAYYATLPAANDALIAVAVKSTGIESDATLKDYDNLSVILAAANDEADFTSYSRKTLASVTVTVDDTNDRTDIDAADVTYTAAGGATNNTVAKTIICYDPDTTTGTDTDLIPLVALDTSYTTTGGDVTIQFNASGFGRAA